MNNNPKPVLTTKQQYRTLKRRFKFLVYENECYQEQLRNLQRKLLKLSRDKNFLLDRLQNYEKVSDSSDDSDAVAVDSADVCDSKKFVKSKDQIALMAKTIDQQNSSSVTASSGVLAPPLTAGGPSSSAPSSSATLTSSQAPKKKRVRNNNNNKTSNAAQFSTPAMPVNVSTQAPKSKSKKSTASKTTSNVKPQTMNMNQQNLHNNQTVFLNSNQGLTFQVLQDGNGHFNVPMSVAPNLQNMDQQNSQHQITNQSPVLQTLQPLQNFDIVNLPSLNMNNNNNNQSLPPAAYVTMQNLHAIQQQETPMNMINNNNTTLLNLTNSSQEQQHQQISVQNNGGIFSQQSMDSQTIDIQ